MLVGDRVPGGVPKEPEEQQPRFRNDPGGRPVYEV